jgi:hypothetical protein
VRFLNGLFDFGSLESLPGFTMSMVKLYGKAGLPPLLESDYDSPLHYPKSKVK